MELTSPVTVAVRPVTEPRADLTPGLPVTVARPPAGPATTADRDGGTGQTGAGPRVTGPERILKPFGVTMLPARDADRAANGIAAPTTDREPSRADPAQLAQARALPVAAPVLAAPDPNPRFPA
jgi:hypothetical protein